MSRNLRAYPTGATATAGISLDLPHSATPPALARRNHGDVPGRDVFQWAAFVAHLRNAIAIGSSLGSFSSLALLLEILQYSLVWP
jgi:hypothetical protein